MDKELETVRELAKEYAEIVLSDVCLDRAERFRRLNSLEIVRPPVLVFEVPWREFENDVPELKTVCPPESRYRGEEYGLRQFLFRWKHFQGDYTEHPYKRVQVSVNNSGDGLKISENVINAESGSAIQSHIFHDVLKDEDDINKIKTPEISIDEEGTRRKMELAETIYRGILPVKRSGVNLPSFTSWDQIPRFHGVDNVLMDFYDRPGFAHALVERFTQNLEHIVNEYERLNIIDTDPYYIHCTPGCTYDLPPKDMDSEKITAADTWGRAAAQLFAVISPEMHVEFELNYINRILDRCGLVYYGCCEPLDGKIDILRRIKKLRRISITPWANVEKAAEQIGGGYVLSYKSNPAFVAGSSVDTAAVENETEKVLAACRKYNTPCEFVLKDISTVSKNPYNLSVWMETVNSVIDKYF